MPPKTEVKRIKPFPFPIVIKIGTHVVNGHVVKMSALGLMIETTSALPSAGDNVEAEFTLPVTKDLIVCTGLIVKLFNPLTGAGSLRLAEMHFKLIPDPARVKVMNYLAAAGAQE